MGFVQAARVPSENSAHSISGGLTFLRREETTALKSLASDGQLRAFEVERLGQRRFALGDRIQFRERDRALD